MADDATTRVRSIVEKVLEADVTDQIAQRGRELSRAVGEATDAASLRAAQAWKDSESTRREARRTLERASRDAAKRGRSTWRRDLEPMMRQLWGRRTLAMGAAGAAVPAGRELVEDMAVRMGIRKRRSERHWAAFLFGLALGAIVGALVAMLTTPKPGNQMRGQLAVSARDAAGRARDAAEKAAERAKGAAGGAGDWVPLFQREAAEGEAEEAGESNES